MIRSLPLALALLAACATDHVRIPDGGGADGAADDAGCPAGRTPCGGGCVDLDSDPSHCGECGLACGDSFCSRGRCDSSCGAGTVACGARCCPDPPGCDATGASCAAPPRDGGVIACPSDPPADGAGCAVAGHECLWARCDTDGELTARCVGGRWDVAAEPCGDFACELPYGGGSCRGDQLCVARIGGALFVECVDNPCGAGPIEASCACEACGGAECTGLSGRSVSCNTCTGSEPCA